MGKDARSYKVFPEIKKRRDKKGEKLDKFPSKVIARILKDTLKKEE